MRHRSRPGLALAALLASSGAARAQDAAVVQVDLAPAVQARARELGRAELDAERSELQRAVAQALARGPLAGAQAHLVIEDIEPTRPTSAQLTASASLNADSTSLGGAAVSGEVVAPGGARLPVRYRDFVASRSDETSFTTWGDADDAFDRLAQALARGRPPNDASRWPPPHGRQTPTGTRIPG